MRIVYLCFFTLLVALVGANRRRNYNYESYPTFPGTPITWSKSQWSTGAAQSTPVQVNFYRSGLPANNGRMTYNGYGHGKSWSDAGTGLDSILYNGGRWQGSGGYFGGYGGGIVSSGIEGGKQTHSTSTGKKILQGSGLRFGFDDDNLLENGVVAPRPSVTSARQYIAREGASNNVRGNGYSTIRRNVFGVSPESNYGIQGSYSSYGRGSRWNSGSFFAPAGVKPMYGDISSIYGQNQIIPGSGQHSVSIPTGISNLYGDTKWSNRGVYAGYGDGLDYYWKWRKNGFQALNSAPISVYTSSQTEPWNKYDGLHGSSLAQVGSGNQFTIRNKPSRLPTFGTGAIIGSGYGFGGEAGLGTGTGVYSGSSAGFGSNLNTGTSARPSSGFTSISKFNSGFDSSSGSTFGLGSGFGQNAAYTAGAGLTNGAATSIGVTSASGAGSYVYSKLNTDNAPSQTSNVFNVYGTKLSGATVPAVGSNILGAYVTGAYQQRPYSTAGIYPMYSQNKWTTDNSGKQTGYYVGYGQNSGTYSKPIRVNLGYGTTFNSAKPNSGTIQYNIAQSLPSQTNAAIYPSTASIIGNNAFSSNLYSDGKWNQRGVYSGYGDGLDFYWNWRKNGFQGKTSSPTGSYTGLASLYTNRYDKSSLGNQGVHYAGPSSAESALNGNSVFINQKPVGSTTSFGNSLTSHYTASRAPSAPVGYGSSVSFGGSRKPTGPNFNVGTNQYINTSTKPSFGSIVFNQNTNKLPSITSPTTTITGLSQLPSNTLLGSGSYSTTGTNYVVGSRPLGSSSAFGVGISPSTGSITSSQAQSTPIFNGFISSGGSYNTGYRPAAAITSFSTSPVKVSSIFASTSPITTGNFANLNLNNVYNYNSNKVASGIVPMYSQSKWSIGNGYYTGYGQNSGVKYASTSYRPGYISSIKNVHSSSTGSQYTPAQSGFVNLSPAAFPSTAGIVGTTGFSSNLYNDGKWSNRGTYYGYGNGLDDYWRWRKNGFQGGSSTLSGTYGSIKGTYNNKYGGLSGAGLSTQAAGQALIGSVLSGAPTLNINSGLVNEQVIAGSGGSGLNSNSAFINQKPIGSTTSFGNSLTSQYTANRAPSGPFGYGSSVSFGGSRKPTGPNFNVGTSQYINTSTKPSFGSIGFNQNTNKLPSITSPTTTITGLSQLPSNTLLGSGSYSTTGTNYVVGSRPLGSSSAFGVGISPSTGSITSSQAQSTPSFNGFISSGGSYNTGYRPAAAITSFSTSPVKVSSIYASTSPITTGNFANLNLNNVYNSNSNKVASGIVPMYSQSKWSIGNGYYTGYGQNSGVKYASTSYRPGYISSIKNIHSSSTGSQYTPAQSGFVNLSPAAFPSTAGIVGTTGFSSNLYNDGKWSNRGTYYGYGNGLDDYWRWRKNGFQGGSSTLSGTYGSIKGTYNNKYGGLSGAGLSTQAAGQALIGSVLSGAPTLNINSGFINGQAISGLDNSGFVSANIAGNKLLASKTNTGAVPSYIGLSTGQNFYMSQLNSGNTPSISANIFGAGKSPAAVITGTSSSADSINKNSALSSSLASLVNGLSESNPAAIYGTYVPSRYQNKPYSTSGITPMYSQNKWTTSGSGGYYTGYGSNSGAFYSSTKYRPNYFGPQYSTSYEGSAQTSPAIFPTNIGSSSGSLGLNLYGGKQWSNNGVFSGYAKNSGAFLNNIGTSNNYKGNSLNGYNSIIDLTRPNAASTGTGQGQYVLSSKWSSYSPAAIGIGAATGASQATGTGAYGAGVGPNGGYSGSWTSRPSASLFGSSSMYSGNKWLVNNGGVNTGVYYGYGSQPTYPSKVQNIFSGSALNAIKNKDQFQLSGNEAGLYSGADWRFNGVYSGYGSGLDSYWRWRRGGFVGNSGKTSNAFANSILGSNSLSSVGGLPWQSGSKDVREKVTNNLNGNFGNSWTTGGLWSGSPANGANIKLTQWSSGTIPNNWQARGSTTNFLKKPVISLSYN